MLLSKFHSTVLRAKILHHLKVRLQMVLMVKNNKCLYGKTQQIKLHVHVKDRFRFKDGYIDMLSAGRRLIKKNIVQGFKYGRRGMGDSTVSVYSYLFNAVC